MKRVITVTAFVLAVAAVVGIATAGQENPLATPNPPDRPFVPSDVIFPDQNIGLRFFHDKHLAEEIDCTTCHDSAEESVASSDVLVPVGFEGEDICTNCHDFDEGAGGEPPAACTTCHFDQYKPTFAAGASKTDSTKATNKPSTMYIPVPNLKMNHKVHIAKGIECSRCHGEMTTLQVATRDNALPLMNTCLECHDGKQAPSECRTCHLAKPDGRLVNHFSSGELMPMGRYRNDNHDDGWLRNHAQTAKGQEQYCSNCHEEKYCLACHNGVSRPIKIHPNNFIITHPVQARRNNPTCTSCHRTQNFCLECHKRMRVVTSSEFATGAATQAFDTQKFGSFHPAGWIGTINKDPAARPARSVNHHSFQAQRNIRACAACHTERTCLGCHKSSSFSGVGINPHGPGFASSAKCRALEARNGRVCAKCHSPADKTKWMCK